MTALSDKDVSGLDVAMHDPFAVCRVQGIRDFDS
jgi:hypothetical protein